MNPLLADFDTTMRAPAEASSSYAEQTQQRLLRQRIIVLGEQVDEETTNRICGQMLLLAAEDGKSDITLYINSPGGSVDHGLAIYDVMQYVPNDIVTVGMGLAASMGQFLLAAGTPGKRFAMPHTRVMMHQPSGGIGGTATDVKILAEQMKYMKRILAERIAQHSGKTVEQIEKDFDRDLWFTAEQAKEYGLIDEVVSYSMQVPSNDIVSQ